MTVLAGLLIIVAAALAQVSILPAFSIFGVQPNLLIILLVIWITVGGQRDALLLIPIAGFVQGLLDSQPLGLAMLAMAPLILMTQVKELRLVQSDLLLAVVLTAAATLVYEGTVLLTLAVTGERLDWLATVLEVLVPATIANVLLLLPLYGLARLLNQGMRRRQAF